MAYKGNNSRGKGRSSSGRRSSGDDGTKRTWNQRTTHEDSNQDNKPEKAGYRDERSADLKPFKRSDRRGSESSDKKFFGNRTEHRPNPKKEDGPEIKIDMNEGGESADWKRSERKSFPRKDDSFRGKPRERKPYAEGNDERGDPKSFVKRDDHFDGEKSERKPYAGRRNDERGDRKPFVKRGDGFDGEKRERKPYAGRRDDERGNRKPFVKRDDDFKNLKNERHDINENDGRSDEKKTFKERGERKSFDRKKYEGAGSKGTYKSREGSARSYDKRSGSAYERKPLRKSNYNPASTSPDKKIIEYPDGTVREERLTRLNKYIANSGICSRREADELIKAGLVSVNGLIVTEMGVKIARTDIVKYNNTAIRKERKVYVLLNKPKDYITTTDDPGERKTVMSLVENAGRERIYPVGRLDRNTTGLLLITNDGELTKRLTHPASNIKKIYHVELDKNLALADFKKIAEGIELEDGFLKVDEINYDGDGKDKKQVGVALHSGKNRIVRRLFESLGYEVTKLDRVIFAGLTKKDLPRGKWRNLSEQEVNMLKMISGTR